MTELQFHREVYRGAAVDEAVKVFSKFGTFELSEKPEHWVVKLTAKTPARERQIAGELSNYALGLSIKNRAQNADGKAK